jgi:hypothetical protein
LSADERILYVAVTRVNQIWPAPLLPDGGVSKVDAPEIFSATAVRMDSPPLQMVDWSSHPRVWRGGPPQCTG